MDAELFRGRLTKAVAGTPARSHARRCAVYYQSSSAKWSRLNSVAAIYEYEVDAQGNSRFEFREWK